MPSPNISAPNNHHCHCGVRWGSSTLAMLDALLVLGSIFVDMLALTGLGRHWIGAVLLSRWLYSGVSRKSMSASRALMGR